MTFLLRVDQFGGLWAHPIPHNRVSANRRGFQLCAGRVFLLRGLQQQQYATHLGHFVDKVILLHVKLPKNASQKNTDADVNGELFRTHTPYGSLVSLFVQFDPFSSGM